MPNLPWNDPWFIVAVTGAFVCLVFIVWPKKIHPKNSQAMTGVRLPDPIRCRSSDGEVVECHVSVPLDYYKSGIEYAVREIIRQMPAAEIRTRTTKLIRHLNREVLELLYSQWHGRPKWKVTITDISVVHNPAFPGQIVRADR